MSEGQGAKGLKNTKHLASKSLLPHALQSAFCLEKQGTGTVGKKGGEHHSTSWGGGGVLEENGRLRRMVSCSWSTVGFHGGEGGTSQLLCLILP